MKVEKNVDNISSKPMKSEYYLFQGEFKNQPEAAKEDGEKDEEGGDHLSRQCLCFLRDLKRLLVTLLLMVMVTYWR